MTMEGKLFNKISRLLSGFEKTFYIFGLFPMVEYAQCYKIYCFLVFAIFFFIFSILSTLEAVFNKKLEDTMFSSLLSIAVSCIMFRMVIFYRKKKVIEKLLVNTDVFADVNNYCSENKDQYNSVLEKINSFVDFAYKMYCMFTVTVLMMMIVPLFNKEKVLLIKVWLPLDVDWKSNDLAFWIMYLFTNTTMAFCAISIGRCLFVWYIMLNISLKYEILGYRLTNLKIQQSSTRSDFIDCIQYHLQIKA